MYDVFETRTEPSSVRLSILHCVPPSEERGIRDNILQLILSRCYLWVGVMIMNPLQVAPSRQLD
jgi:hypothetical protein